MRVGGRPATTWWAGDSRWGRPSVAAAAALGFQPVLVVSMTGLNRHRASGREGMAGSSSGLSNSGSVAVAAAKHCPTLTVLATDISAPAVAVARENAERHGLADRIRTKQADLLTDLSRRDFTINTLAMDISPEKFGQIIDVYGGRSDISNKIIRTPLKPERTFYDDPLRMMRAVRFASRLRFRIEQETYQAIAVVAQRLSIISAERIRDEFNKILLADEPSSGLKMLDESGLLEIFLPEVSALKGVEQRKKYHHKDVFYHTLEVLDNIAPATKKLELRLAALFHDIAKPKTKRFVDGEGWTFHGHEVVGQRMAGGILRRLRYSSEVIQYVMKLVNLHLRPMALVNEEVTSSAVRRLIFSAGEDIDDLMILCRADITSKNVLKVKKYRANYDRVLEKITEVEERDRLRNFQPPVNGNEIMSIFGLQPGPQVGRIKKFIEEAVLNGEVPNEHEACLNYIIEHKGELIN